MKKNKSQILFFFLCLILGAVLLLFLYKNREAEHERTAQLVQEAASSMAAVSDEGVAAAAESTAAPATDSATASVVTDTAESSASESNGTEAAQPAAAEEHAAAEPTAAPAEPTAAPAEQAAPADPEAAATASDETAIAALAAGAPQIRLNTHAVTLPIGSTFSYMQYIGSMTDDKDNYNELAHRIELSGNVNTAVAGTYTVTYMVRDAEGNMSNTPTLTVTVQ